MDCFDTSLLRHRLVGCVRNRDRSHNRLRYPNVDISDFAEVTFDSFLGVLNKAFVFIGCLMIHIGFSRCESLPRKPTYTFLYE